ncbi:hypothetical protein WN48_00523 [Eufriesea mexicana]|nr:hypothetical protein WN48_00523 [Eufriesea mexicana]
MASEETAKDGEKLSDAFTMIHEHGRRMDYSPSIASVRLPETRSWVAIFKSLAKLLRALLLRVAQGTEGIGVKIKESFLSQKIYSSHIDLLLCRESFTNLASDTHAEVFLCRCLSL